MTLVLFAVGFFTRYILRKIITRKILRQADPMKKEDVLGYRFK